MAKPRASSRVKLASAPSPADSAAAALHLTPALSPTPAMSDTTLRSSQQLASAFASLPPSTEPETISVRGAAEHNLRIDALDIPKKRLVVLTGVSGSGKSSLAFDTLYAEGQRRYVESLSAYARQFLGQLDKPKYESLRGLSPTIAIEQKSASSNPRSTIGTVTEIYDHLRVLFARVGHQHCHQCGRPIAAQSATEIVRQILQLPTGTQLTLLAPLARDRKGTFTEVFENAKRAGYVRARIDGALVRLDEELPALSKKHKHSIDIVTDRITIDGEADTRRRLHDSVEATLKLGEGTLIVSPQAAKSRKDDEAAAAPPEYMVSEKRACVDCGIAFAELAPQTFSFNSPLGMCPECTGLGTRLEMDADLVIPDKKKSVRDGAVVPWANTMDRAAGWGFHIIQGFADAHHIDLDMPWEKLPAAKRTLLLHGDAERVAVQWQGRNSAGSMNIRFEGILTALMRRYKQTTSQYMRTYYEQFLREAGCTACTGSRLRPEARAVFLLHDDQGRGLHALPDVCRLTVRQATHLLGALPLSGERQVIAAELLKEINARLSFLMNVGLDYLTLDRASASLSGGEAQRIRLASQLGSELSGVMYVLDEPSIGLHQRDNRRLIETLKRLRDQGNTVLVVEHDAETILESDWVVDFGPGAGRLGGHVIFNGTPSQLLDDPKSITGAFLANRERIEVPETRRPPTGWLTVYGAREHNLQDLDVRIPLGVLCAITGVSGAGKSSLINGILRPALMRALHDSRDPIGAHRKIDGITQIDKLIAIDQQPIGRTPRSNPATYTKAFDHIRDLFAALPESRAYGYQPGRFSFNVKGGRCESCEGDGMKRVEMHFLADVMVPCEVCRGRRYNEATLRVQYKGRSIADLLDTPVAEARELFANHRGLSTVLETLCDVGLGYLSLGQPAPTLSGGEAQRVKLSRELCRRDTGRTLYLLDEPTTGLHFEDIRRLLSVLYRLVEAGNTVVVIEHNLDVIKCADWLVDLGPEGGSGGGLLLAEGTPETVAQIEASHTARFLRPYLSGPGYGVPLAG